MTSLSSQERTVIETMIKLNHSIREIARFLKRSPATITYELNRIKPYNAQQAHHLAQCNQHKHGRHPSLTAEISAFLNHHIGCYLKMVTGSGCSCIGYCFQDPLQLDSSWFT